MSTLVPRGTVVFPDLFRWLESWNPVPGHIPVRLEDYLDNGHYVVCAELPGMDPAKDIKVSVHGDVLSITGERAPAKHESGRSEFHYGSFARSVTLPAGADTKQVQAAYEAGILRVTVPMHAEKKEGRQIPITAAESD